MMKNILKKIGSVLFCVLPFLLVFGIQFAVSIPAVMLKSTSLLAKHPEYFSDFEAFQSALVNAVSGDFSIWISLIYAIISGLIMCFWYWKKFVPKKIPKRKLSQIINFKTFIGLLFLIVGMQYVASYLVALINFIHPAWYDTYVSIMETAGFNDVSLLLIIYSVIIAPISEELIFRGVTMHYAKRIMPFWVANIFQAALFGVFHQNIVQGVYAFVIGLFCGYVCNRGGSIYLSILFHMLFNAWGTLLPSFYVNFYAMLPITVLAVWLGFTLYNKGINERAMA